MKGKVKFFNRSKGFGFVVGEDEKDYFVHLTGLTEGLELKDDDAVVFDVEDGERGPKAVNVALDDGSSSAEPAAEDSQDQEDFEAA